jgi:hypothetical protein
MSENDKRVQVQRITSEEAPGYKQAAMLYCEEKVNLKERVDGSHPDFDPEEAPWS